MQNVVAERLRRAVARDQRIGKQRDRAAALVLDFVLDGEQIMVVDRDGAAEDQSLAVVVAQRNRMIDGQRAAAFLLPDRIRTRHFLRRAGGRHPAELRVIGVRRARRREQHDRRRAGIDGFAVLLERKIVDARAFEVDAAAKPRRVDRNMRRCRDHRLARVRVDGAVPAAARARPAPRARRLAAPA